jgi:glycosyltransferase involved in cell wall biosynthesis
MRVIFINRFYWPETPATAQLLTDLAEGLAARGWDVTVITSGPAELAAQETRGGVLIVRVPALPRAGGSLASKARDFLRFHLGAAAQLWQRARRDTVVVALTDPPLLAVTGAAIARLRGARLAHWVHDIYPELAITLAGQQWARALLPLRNAAWRTADRCVTLGEDMASRITAAGVAPTTVAVIPNWSPRGVEPADPAAIRSQRAVWGLTDRCVVMYSGDLGRVHDLDPLLAVAARLQDEPRLCFVLVGGGPRRDVLQAAAQQRGLNNFRFLPAQPRAELPVALGVGDIHLVTLLPSCASLVFPSKLYGAAAIGRPILYLGPKDAEPARVIRAAGCGLTMAPDDPDAIAAELRQLASDPARRNELGAAARRLAEAGGAERAVAAWHNQLARLASG